MNNNQQKAPQRPERPEIQPHGTTSDQIAEMESEGPGQVGQNKKPAPQQAPAKRHS